MPLLDAKAPDAVRAYAREQLARRMAVIEKHLAGREFLLDSVSVADAYLTTILSWTAATAVNLGEWPAVQAYQQRMLKRPSIARAFGE